MKIDPETRLKRIGETVDRMITLDIWCKFAGNDVVQGMYEAALAVVKPRHRSLTLAGAEGLLRDARPGSQVLICTGLVLPPWMVCESDGPVGAAILARMLNLAIKASPAILVAAPWIEPMRKVVIAAGLTPLSDVRGLEGRFGACAVMPFPTEDGPAAELAARWIGSGDVTGVIAIETPGRTETGRYVTGTAGKDISAGTARFDFLFEEAAKRNVLTIGIGDHGGELGLGAIAETVKALVPTAKGRGTEGIATTTSAAIPLIAGISNWGAYGLAAVLAALTNRADLIHDGAAELRVVRAAADAGFLAGMVSLPLPIVDGMSAEANAAFVELLRLAVQRAIAAPYPKAVGFTPEGV